MRRLVPVCLLLGLIHCGGSEFSNDNSSGNTSPQGGAAGSAGTNGDAGETSAAGAAGDSSAGAGGTGDAGASNTTGGGAGLSGSAGSAGAGGSAEAGAAGASGQGGAAGSAGAPEEGPRYVFVSSQKHQGKFGETVNTGLAGADAWCKQLANESNQKNANLQGRSWRAWLSTSSKNAKERVLPPSGVWPRYLLVDGTEVFPAGFLFGENAAPTLPENAINVDENGESHPTDIVWTGTSANGLFYGGGDCEGWSSDSEKDGSLIGGTATSEHWTDGNTSTCNQALHLYCFEVAGP